MISVPEDDAVRKPPRFELALDFLKARLLSIVAIVSVVAGFLMVIGFDISLARWQKIAAFTAIAFLPVGAFLGKYLTSLLYNPRSIFVVDLDASRVDGALFEFPYDDFRELTVTDEDGNKHPGYSMTQLTPNLWTAKNVDLENSRAIGTWRGTLDDRELVRALGKIKECRGMLQEDAQRGWAIENSGFSIVRHAAQDEIRTVVETFESGTLASDGESVTEAIDTALSDHGLDEDLPDDLDDMVSPEDVDDLENEESDETGTEDKNGADVDLENSAEVSADG